MRKIPQHELRIASKSKFPTLVFFVTNSPCELRRFQRKNRSIEYGAKSYVSSLVNVNTRLIVQGITGREGTYHAKGCVMNTRSSLVTNSSSACVTPGKGGTTHEGWPVFNTVEEAVKETGANATVIFVPPPAAADGILEAVDAGVPLIVCITEGIPVLDMTKVWPPGQSLKVAPRRRTRTAPASSPLARRRSASCPSRIHLSGQRRHRVEIGHLDL